MIEKLKETPHWSYSALQCYLTCPLKYKFRYIDNAEPELNRLYAELFERVVLKENQLIYDIKTSGVQNLIEGVMQ